MAMKNTNNGGHTGYVKSRYNDYFIQIYDNANCTCVLIDMNGTIYPNGNGTGIREWSPVDWHEVPETIKNEMEWIFNAYKEKGQSRLNRFKLR